jgi:AcrR family transcriptional regulator
MRRSAPEQRSTILAAALEQFGMTGMDSTAVDVIARKAHVSAAYVHRLFGAKSELVTAAIAEHTDRLLGVLRSAAGDRGPDETALRAMGAAYAQLHDDDLGALRRQLHVWGAAHDPAHAEAVQSSFEAIWDEVGASSGAGSDEVRRFMAHAVLLTILASLDLMDLFETEA